MALNYGSREEIISTIKKLIKNKKKINEININKFLYTHNIPNPDILIRTGNTFRISNFLLWQIIYSEIFLLKKCGQILKKKIFSKSLRNLRK